MDIDGKQEYSSTRMIRKSIETNETMTITSYPNPAVNELRITVPSNWQSKKLSIELYNVNGQLASKTQIASGSQTETLNVSKLSSGIYIVKANCGAETATQRIVKK